MKKLVLVFAAIIIAFGFSSNLLAQSTVTGTTAGAVLITPISLTQVTPLHFGVMAVLAATPGTCVLATDGTRTATGGINLSAQAPAATNAAYTVSGQASTSYALTLPATVSVNDGSGHDMTIGTLLARFNGASSDATTSTLNGSGADSFTVGGTLAVPAAQASGVYSGTFNVTVAYN